VPPPPPPAPLESPRNTQGRDDDDDDDDDDEEEEEEADDDRGDDDDEGEDDEDDDDDDDDDEAKKKKSWLADETSAGEADAPVTNPIADALIQLALELEPRGHRPDLSERLRELAEELGSQPVLLETENDQTS
jgi:ABC-type Zn2+ transport system substrate-binding protein/surface adhesin